ncbi:MAG: hypothetical protein B6D39_03615 [Anaerolineae bacterium UTCFX2]|nr:MAG: hypothetical protein B6D39_03615 [Anaerolineae bacterium UTCFX2]
MNARSNPFRLKTVHLLICLLCAASLLLSPLGFEAARATDQPGAGRRTVGAPLAAVYYVNANASGGGDGLSWASAFQTVQDGLAAASSGSEVWVAQGVYTPGAPGDRTRTFTLKEGVKVYGGFAGTESLRSERDPEKRRTILSGDLEGDDDGTSAAMDDNSYHVVTAPSGISTATLLDGFIIQGGNADGSNPNDRGGGMLNQNSDLVLYRITFLGNRAIEGGAMHNSGSNPRIFSCSFLNNTAGSGGAIYNASGSTPRVVNTVLNANLAADGGAIYNASGSSLDMTNSTVTYNTADNGGGIYNATSGPKVKNSILWGNQADNGPQILNSFTYTFELQQSLVQGGEPPFVTVTGALLTMDPQFQDPKGLDNQPGTLDDNLRLQFTSPAIDAGDNSLVQADSYDLNENGNTNDEAPDRDGRARRVEIAFVVDSGSGAAPLVDLGAHEARVVYVRKTGSGLNNGTSWLNAYRSLPNALSKTATGDELWVAQGVYTPTLPLATPIVTDTFQIPQGVAVYGGFAGNEVVRNQRNPLTRKTVLSGDLAGNDNGWANRTENSLNVVRMSGVDARTVLDGFTIQGGNAQYYPYAFALTDPWRMAQFLQEQLSAPLDSPIYRYSGGGMYLEQASPLLVNLTFYQNYAWFGGGAQSRLGQPYFFNCAWVGNQALSGGGLYTFSSDAEIVTALFNGNQAEGPGGALYIVFSSPLVINATFSQNKANLRDDPGLGGDAVHSTQSSSRPIFRNTIFWGNDDQPFRFDSGSAATFNYVNSQTSCPGGSTCTNLQTGMDPLFFNPLGGDGLPGTLDDDLRLPFSSPARDAGFNAYLPLDVWDVNNNGNITERMPYDLALQPRLQGVAAPYTVDLGAYEAAAYKTYLPSANRP